jgi:hypothetical protein
MANKKINYSDPLPREVLNQILKNGKRAARNLEQHIINKKQTTQTKST